MKREIPYILVVDDDQHQLDTIRRGLFLCGYDSLGVQSVDAALTFLDSPEGGKIDLVLTDLTMPGSTGLYLIEELRKSKPSLPVIVITGLAATNEIATIQQYGIPILRKPFAPDWLDQAIKALL